MKLPEAYIKYPGLNEFDFRIQYSKINKNNHVDGIDLHSHKEFEIYINLSGDVSFLVENKLYPITRGDIIIARPGQKHHCVYHSEKEHTLYWILFEAEKNKSIFNFLFAEESGNFISPPSGLKKELIELCNTLATNELSDFDRYYCFIKFMEILKKGINNNVRLYEELPGDLSNMINYIEEHISENIKISDIADALFISESTVCRRFKEYLGIKPIEFIHKRKMIAAAELLRAGESVLDAGISVGYSDNSYFIGLFKRYYGITPLQFKKDLSKH